MIGKLCSLVARRAVLSLALISVAACSSLAAQAQSPGQPQFTVSADGEGSFDVAVEWPAPAGRVVKYVYSGGTNSGPRWTAGGDSDKGGLLLRRVPAAGEYWFCVRAVDAAGQESGNRCNSFATPSRSPVAAKAALPPANECANPRPEWIWCDDFEQDRISAYFEASMPRVNGVGIDGSYGAVGRYLPGKSEAGNLKLAFGRTPARYIRPVDDGARNYREIYWRMYVKHPTDWQGGGADKLSRATVLVDGDWRQAMIAHVWTGKDGGAEQHYLRIDPASGTDERGRIRATRYNDFANLRWLGARTGRAPTFGPGRNGEWRCVEARVRLNEAGRANGIFELWVDGVLNAQRDDLNWVGKYEDYGINAVFFENFWNNGSPVEQERYMDNVVVSTAPIGCGD